MIAICLYIAHPPDSTLIAICTPLFHFFLPSKLSWQHFAYNLLTRLIAICLHIAHPGDSTLFTLCLPHLRTVDPLVIFSFIFHNLHWRHSRIHFVLQLYRFYGACKIATWYFFGDLDLFVPWYGIFLLVLFQQIWKTLYQDFYARYSVSCKIWSCFFRKNRTFSLSKEHLFGKIILDLCPSATTHWRVIGGSLFAESS